MSWWSDTFPGEQWASGEQGQRSAGQDSFGQPQVVDDLMSRPGLGSAGAPGQWGTMGGAPQQVGGVGGHESMTNPLDIIKQLVGNDYSQAHLQQILPQLRALGVEVQNQQRGDLRPRFLLPGGEQWDFGPGGWINSGHGIQPGFGDPSQAPGGSGLGTIGSIGQGGSMPGGGSMSDYLHSTPGYQFTLSEGLKGIQNSAAGRGTLLTGGTLKGMAQYATGLADQTYGGAWDRQYRLADLGLRGIGGGYS